MPYLTDSTMIEDFSFKFSIFILFVLKYPSHLRGQRIEKIREIIKIGDSVEFQNYPLHLICKNESLGLQGLLEKNLMFSSLSNEFIAIQMLLTIDFFDLLIIDPMHFLEQFLTVEGKAMIIEEFTMDKNTEKNVILAIEKGFVLLIKDFDESLRNVVNEINSRKKEKLLKYHVAKFLDGGNEEEQENEKKEEITLFGKKIQIHPKFRMILVYHYEKTIIPKETSSQVFRIYFSYNLIS